MRDICCDLCLINDFFQTCFVLFCHAKSFCSKFPFVFSCLQIFWTWGANIFGVAQQVAPIFFFSQQHSRAHSMSWRTARGPTQLLYLFTPPKASTPTASTRTETRQGPKRPQGRLPAPWRPGCRNTRRTLTPPKERRSCLLSLREWHSHRWAAWYVFRAQFV